MSKQRSPKKGPKGNQPEWQRFRCSTWLKGEVRAESEYRSLSMNKVLIEWVTDGAEKAALRRRRAMRGGA